jgi:hypothetical protein
VTFRLVLAAHLACACGATALFWVPIFATKGGPLHIRAGRLYSRLIYLTALTGTPLALLLFAGAPDAATRRTAIFLGYLLTILVMPVFHGVRVARAHKARTPVGSPLHTGLAVAAIVAGIALGIAAIGWRVWPYLLLSPIGPVLGIRALLYAARARRGPVRWREEHIVAMVMSGIGVHTAAFVFGSSRTMHLNLGGAAAYVPWVLPAAVGLPWLVWRIRQERRG